MTRSSSLFFFLLSLHLKVLPNKLDMAVLSFYKSDLDMYVMVMSDKGKSGRIGKSKSLFWFESLISEKLSKILS